MNGPVWSFRAPSDRPYLWAPSAGSVQIERGGVVSPCERQGQHWVAPAAMRDGDRYRFVVDGGSVPDPRSRWQPDGVHGPSAWVGHVPAQPAGAGTWPSSLARSVIYELHVGTFSAEGTFVGAIDHLDHLVSLGVTHVELMPVAAFDGRYGWGYDGVDLFAPHPGYGTEQELRRLVEACHDRGLAVLIDVVLNHLGPSGNYLQRCGPYFTDRYSTPWGDAVNLDGPDADGVRRFLMDAACHWLEDLDVDGLRLDAVHALYDTSAVPLLEQLEQEVRRIGERSGRARLLVAESDRNDPRLVTPGPGGTGLDGVWADDLHHCLHVALTGERLGYYEDVLDGDLALALTQAQTHQGRWSAHRRRSVGRPVASIGSERFVVALQNHDQVGNRAGGERLHHLVGIDRTAAAAALVLLSPFSTLLFQGEEWAASSPFPYFSDHTGELGEAVRRGRRAEFAAFGWTEDQVADPQAPSTFDSARLPWAEVAQGAHAEMVQWYRTLVGIRTTHGSLGPTVLPSSQRAEVVGSSVAVERDDLTVVANLGEHTVSRRSSAGDVCLERAAQRRGDGTLELDAGGVVVLDRS